MTLGRNILWNLVAFLWLSLLIILVTPYMVRHLGLDAFGVWSVLVAFAGYLTTIDFGVGNAMIRFLAAENEHGDHRSFESYLRSGLALQTLLGALAAAMFFLLAPTLANRWAQIPEDLVDEAVASFRITAFAVFLTFLVSVYTAALAALRRFDLLALRTILLYSLQYLLIVLVLSRGGGLLAVAMVNAVGTTLVLAYLFVAVARLLPGVNLLPGWHRGAVRELLRFGRFKFPAQISASVLQQLDRFALAVLLPVGRVSFYAIPLRLSQRVSQIVEQIATPFYPAVSAHLAAGRAKDMEIQYRQGIRLIAAVACGALAVAGGFAHPILEVWMGEDFARAGAGPLRILLLAYAANALATLPSVAADAAGRPGIPAVFLGAGSLVHAGLLWWWIPHFGLMGAAGAVLVGFSIPLLFGVPTMHRRISGLPKLTTLARETRGTILAGLITGLGGFFVAGTGYPASGVLPLLLSLAGAAVLYGSALFGFGGLNLSDVSRLMGLFRAVGNDAHRD